MNKYLHSKLVGQPTQYKSASSLTDIDEAVYFTVEFLNTLSPPGMPSRNHELKVGATIIIFRNLDPPIQCSFTRLSVQKILSYVMHATVMTGNVVGLGLGLFHMCQSTVKGFVTCQLWKKK